MSEKTAEEKLRQTLEGEPLKPSKGKDKILRTHTSDALKREADAFIHDFEKRLNAGITHKPKSPPAKPKTIITSDKNQPQTQIIPEFDASYSEEPAPLPVITLDEKIQEIPEFDDSYSDEPDIIPDYTQKTQNFPEIDNSYSEESEFLPAAKPENKKIESSNDEQENENQDSNDNDSESLQDFTEINEPEPLPVIDNDSDEQENETQDSITYDSEISEPDSLNDFDEMTQDESQNLPEIPIIEDKDDSENELPDIPVIDDSEDSDNDEPEEISPDSESELEQEPDSDPEAEAAPVSITMPEDTNTAENKLMADIAEAMTGNPLTLDSPDTPEPYKLPDFENLDNNDQQTAEEKLRANIAQAMSESPLDAAQDKSNQDLEQDLNPFDDLPLTDLKPAPEPEPEPEKESAPEESFIPDFNEEPEELPQENQESSLDDSENNQDNEPDDFFSIIDDDSHDETESEPESKPEDSHEQTDSELEPIEIENIDSPEPDNPPAGEEENLLQEIANISNSNIDSNPEPEPESEPDLIPDIDSESEPESDSEPEILPSLLDDNEHPDPDSSTDDDANDWDISSLGALSEAASIIGDDHHEDDTDSDTNLPEVIEPETDLQAPPESESVIITHINPDEERSNEKIMSIRDKLENRKGGNDGTSAKRPWAALITALLLTGLLVVGVMLYFRVGSLIDRISAGTDGLSLNAPSAVEAPASYEYSIDFILDPNITERMTQRGKAGWQVVGSRRTQDTTTGQYGYEFIFMRRIKGGN